MRRIFFLFIGLLLQPALYAQTSKTDPTDVQGWYGTELTIDLPKKWTAKFDYQGRYVNNLKTYNGSYVSFGASKELADFVELQAEYRLALVQAGTYHRWSLGAEASHRFAKVDFGLRALVQNSVQDFDDVTVQNDKSGYWRVRLAAKLAVAKKLAVYLQTEPIMKFGGDYFIDNWRNTLGLKYKLSKNLKLDAYYIYRPDFAKKTYNRYFHINGISIGYDFKPGRVNNPRIG